MSKINSLQTNYPTMINWTDFQDNPYAENGKHNNIGKRLSYIISGFGFVLGFFNTNYGWPFSGVHI